MCVPHRLQINVTGATNLPTTTPQNHWAAHDLGVLCGKFLQAFVQLPELAQHLVKEDFIGVLIVLLQSQVLRRFFFMVY